MSKRIKPIRKKLGITQGVLAEAMGIPVLTVSAWECGRQEISFPHAKKMVRIYGHAGVTLDIIAGFSAVSDIPGEMQKNHENSQKARKIEAAKKPKKVVRKDRKTSDCAINKGF